VSARDVWLRLLRRVEHRIPFLHLVDIITPAPGPGFAPPDFVLPPPATPPRYLWRARLSLSDLVAPGWLALLNNAESTIRVLPCTARKDRSNTFSLASRQAPSPSAPGAPPRLRLIVDPPTYGQLGLLGIARGQSIPKKKHPPARYAINIDLSPEKFRKKQRTRILWALARIPWPVECLVAAAVAELPFPENAAAAPLTDAWQVTELADIFLPQLSPSALPEEVGTELYEWLGLVRHEYQALLQRRSRPTEDDASKIDENWVFHDALPAAAYGHCRRIRGQGMLSALALSELLTTLSQHHPWLAVHFAPFTDTPHEMPSLSFLLTTATTAVHAFEVQTPPAWD
jgi:hypothetical protein